MFNDFKKALQDQFSSMLKNGGQLFLTDIEKDVLWEKYLESFPEGTNPIYKERREFDCNSCKQFIRPYGNVVSIKDNQLVSIWDIPNLDYPFDVVAKKMSELVKSQSIKNVFVSKTTDLGVDSNKQLLENGTVITWEHFYFKLPRNYVYFSDDSIEAAQGVFRDSKNVFRRSMEELTLDSGNIILDLIEQKSLYRGEEFKKNIETFIAYKKQYDKLSESEKDNWCWSNSFDNPISRIRNTAIGTLLIDISGGIDIDVAVTKFEKVMAPTNYKRPNAIFTKKMIEDAEKKLVELGLSDSLERRFAQIEDITVNKLIFVNRDARKKLKNSVFDDLKESVPQTYRNFDKVEEISIETFVKDILPGVSSLEIMMENRHSGNLVSLIAPNNFEVPTMFKWDNNFSWSYNGDITDSIKQNVKKAGGNVEGVLRFSFQWNVNEYNPNDFDAHCIEPDGNEIYYGQKVNLSTTGNLDIDITRPESGIPAVENITWLNKSKMKDGVYKFFVHNFCHKGGRGGFSAEIEYEGQIYSYEYPKELKQGEKINVAEIMFDKKTGIKFISSLESSVSTKNIWGIKTNQFSKVNVLMYSPNYWNGQKGIGNKHYLFFIDGCKNETTPRGFFNEFLKEDLMSHKKVFEALGSRLRVQESENQLSGLGFSSTQKNSILVKVEGSFTRMLKIIF